MAELSVQIGADIKDLLKKLDLSEKQLKKLEKVSAKSGANIGKVGTKASKGIDKFGKSTANAVPATQEFSRIIQDAPFGIQGVANNITQLTDQFGNLAKKTGSSKVALKAMLSTLSGPAGILLAVSAVTSLLVSYGDEILNAAGSTNELAKATSEYIAGAQSEIQKIKQLVEIAQDENKSKKVRKGAIDALNKDYGKYLGNLTEENISTKELAKNVNLLSESLLLNAKIKGAQDLIEERNKENSTKLLELEESRVKTQKKLAKVQALDKGAERTRGLRNTQIALQRINDEIASLEQKSEEATKPLLTILKGLRESSFETKVDVKTDDSKVKNSKSSIKIKGIIDLETPEEAKAKFDKFADGAIHVLKNSFDIRSKDLGASLINVDGANEEIKKFAEGFQENTSSITENSAALSGSISSSFSSLSNNLVSSLGLANDGFEGFASGIAKTVTDIIAIMLAQSISQSIAGATASGTATGPAAIFTTPAFIAQAIGGVIAAFAAIPSFAKGGFSGDDNLAFLNKNELVLRPMEQAALFNMLKGSGISNAPVSNNVSDGVVGEVVLRGDKQVIQLRRGERKMSRYYNS